MRARSKAAFDVVFGFDMETDIGSFTPFYEGVKQGTPRLLAILKRQGIRATFFWTGHAAISNPEVVRTVRAAGHETGCHGLYHETLGAPLFPLPNNWPLLPSEVEGRIREATRWVQSVAGVRPRSFRCPRLWGSTAVVNALERLGYRADASLPQYTYRERLTPYHPSAKDWTRNGHLNLVEIPNFCDLSMHSKDPYHRDRDQWPLFRTKSAAALMRKVAAFRTYVTERGVRPVLCFYFHPWEFQRMPQGALDFGEAKVLPRRFIVQRCGGYACAQFERLCSLLQSQGARFLTCREIVREYCRGPGRKVAGQ